MYMKKKDEPTKQTGEEEKGKRKLPERKKKKEKELTEEKILPYSIDWKELSKGINGDIK